MRTFIVILAVLVSSCGGGSTSNSNGSNSSVNAISAPTQVNVVSSH